MQPCGLFCSPSVISIFIHQTAAFHLLFRCSVSENDLNVMERRLYYAGKKPIGLQRSTTAAASAYPDVNNSEAFHVQVAGKTRVESLKITQDNCIM